MEGARLGVSWAGTSGLCVFSADRKSRVPVLSGGPPAPDSGGPPSFLHILQPQITLFHPIIRKLVNEANGTFLSLQTLAVKPSYGDCRADLLKISRQYRAIIRACLENLHETIEETDNGREKDMLSTFVNIFYCSESIWHICEILFIDNMPGDIIMPQLLEWVRIHFPNHEQAASQLLEECEIGAEENLEYWNTVIGMIMQGRIEIARALLRLHTNSNTNQFMIAENVLRSMPSYDASLSMLHICISI